MNLVRDRIAAFTSDRLVDLTGVSRMDLVGGRDPESTHRDTKREVAQALNFAYGLDPSGRRLPMVSDDLPAAMLRRAVKVRDRHDLTVAAVYARADHFDDGQPNVRVLNSAPSMINRDRSPSRHLGGRNSASEPRASSMRQSSAASHRSLPEPGSGRRFGGDRSLRPTASGVHSRGIAPTFVAPSHVGPVTRQGATATRNATALALEPNSAALVVGATALQFDRSEKLQSRQSSGVSLRAVTRRPKMQGQAGVVVFWSGIVVALMFTAVVMWAQNTARTIELEEVNERLTKEESTYTQLRVEVARLQSPQRIEREASRLGLSTPANITFVVPGQAITTSPAK
jgi:cell division protein FtsL